MGPPLLQYHPPKDSTAVKGNPRFISLYSTTFTAPNKDDYPGPRPGLGYFRARWHRPPYDFPFGTTLYRDQYCKPASDRSRISPQKWRCPKVTEAMPGVTQVAQYMSTYGDMNLLRKKMPMVDSAHGGFGTAFKFPPNPQIDDFGNTIPRTKREAPGNPKPVTGDYEVVTRKPRENSWLDNTQRCMPSMLDPKSMKYHMPGHPLFMPGREEEPKKNLEHLKRDLYTRRHCFTDYKGIQERVEDEARQGYWPKKEKPKVYIQGVQNYAGKSCKKKTADDYVILRGVKGFFSAGTNDTISENGLNMAEKYFAEIRPLEGTLLAMQGSRGIKSNWIPH